MENLTDTLKNTTGFDEKLQLLKQWRNRHWELALYYRSIQNEQKSIEAVIAADALNCAIEIIMGNFTYPPPNILSKFSDIPYTEGEWPE